MGRLIIYFSLICFYTLSVAGQVTERQRELLENSAEQVYLNTNAKLLFSGENLKYNLFIPLNTTPYRSKLAYVELVDQDNKRWIRQKVKIDSAGVGTGNFDISTDAPSGNYKLLAYTNWSLYNNEEAIQVQDLVILNPFISNTASEPAATDIYTISYKEPENILESKNIESEPIQLILDKNVYNTRQQVVLNIQADRQDVFENYQLSIRKIEPVSINQELLRTYFTNTTETLNLLPEIKGELISGSIETDAQFTNSGEQLISISLPGKNYSFKISKTDATGRFAILLDENVNVDKGLIQIVDATGGSYTPKLQENSPDLSDQLEFAPLKLNVDLEEWITTNAVNIQVADAYKELNIPEQQDSLVTDYFYHPYAVRYDLDAYTRFPSMQETFIEVVERAAMRFRGDEVRLKVYNRDVAVNNNQNNLDPLVLIDGILILDHAIVANLDPELVDFIDVVPEQYRYGPELYGGVIALVTKDHDFTLAESAKIMYFDRLPIAEFTSTDTKDYSHKSYKRIPDYRKQLLWKEHLNLNRNNLYSVHFFTSDLEGNYEVKLTAFKASGDASVFTKIFSVKDQL